jgi:hypothetical protein
MKLEQSPEVEKEMSAIQTELQAQREREKDVREWHRIVHRGGTRKGCDIY